MVKRFNVQGSTSVKWASLSLSCPS